MSVYVDDGRHCYGRMTMCHMIADSSKELHAMAERIGLAHKWIQKPGTYQEHYDVCLSTRKKAVAAGAIEITEKDMARKCIARRERKP